MDMKSKPEPCANTDKKENETSKEAQTTTFSIEQLLPKISMHRGSITDLRVDCVVNAANNGLWAGAGVCGAIFSAAGYSKLTRECDGIIDKYGRIPTGESVLTNGYQLHAKHIIHCVGPTSQNNDALSSCYRTALDLCILHNIRSIAFPCISTGIFGFNPRIASAIALQTVKAWLINAMQVKYTEYVEKLKERQKLKMEQAMKSKSQQNPYSYQKKKSNDDDDSDSDNGNKKKDKKEETNEQQIDTKVDKDNDNENDDNVENNETVFDRIDSIIFCCFDYQNWELYKQNVPKVFPSTNAKYSYLWTDKLKQMELNKKQKSDDQDVEKFLNGNKL